MENFKMLVAKFPPKSALITKDALESATRRDDTSEDEIVNDDSSDDSSDDGSDDDSDQDGGEGQDVGPPIKSRLAVHPHFRTLGQLLQSSQSPSRSIASRQASLPLAAGATGASTQPPPLKVGPQDKDLLRARRRAQERLLAWADHEWAIEALERVRSCPTLNYFDLHARVDKAQGENCPLLEWRCRCCQDTFNSDTSRSTCDKDVNTPFTLKVDVLPLDDDLRSSKILNLRMSSGTPAELLSLPTLSARSPQ
ncbi:hypothetical protein CF319_g7051 [Tilletia indica]|nr:hypothetical protein CF319_g7051 [Tilletia indica]